MSPSDNLMAALNDVMKLLPKEDVPVSLHVEAGEICDALNQFDVFEETKRELILQKLSLFVTHLSEVNLSSNMQVAKNELFFHLGFGNGAKDCYCRAIMPDSINMISPTLTTGSNEISTISFDTPFSKPKESYSQIEILRDYIIKFQPHCDRYLAKIASPRGKSVLVIGAGHGTEMLWCIRNGAREVIGLDISSRDTDALNLALKHYNITNPPPFVILQMPAEEAATLGRKFDLVISNNVFEHIADISSAFAACKKLINADTGRIAIFTDPLYYSSMGAHLALEPWEHLWNEEQSLRSRATPYQWQEYTSLNKMRHVDFMDAIQINGLTILQHETVKDRNIRLLPEYIERIYEKIKIPISVLTTEGIAVELCHSE